MGISLYVVSAVCGNFHKESTVNPDIYEGLHELTPSQMTDNSVYGGYGLGQWTSGTFSWGTLTRRANLINWLDANGYSWDDGNGQLEFLIQENYWRKNYGSYNSLTEFLNSSDDNINELTKCYFRCWEGINNGTLTERQVWANKFYDYIYVHYDDPSITTWVTGNRYLSESQQMNNAVLVARYLMDGTPAPTPPTPPPPIPPPTPPTPPYPPTPPWRPTEDDLASIMLILLKRRKRRKFY